MSQIILDFGSANTCHNDKAYIKRMYDELKAVDTGKHSIVAKWQLFKEVGTNVPLTHECFQYAYEYGNSLGYQVTSSVFDKESLDFLLQFDVPFIKLANRRDLDWLIGEVPRRLPAYVSFGNKDAAYLTQILHQGNISPLLCVSKYPANIEEYEEIFGNLLRSTAEGTWGISDHTANFGLWYRYRPNIIEWHYMLNDSTGLDAGPFARTPAQLAEAL